MSPRRRFPRYVSVAERKAKAAGASEKMRRQNPDIQPVRVQGRIIAHSFWGKAWCKHLEQFSDFSNRLPRGRSYVRNGSVIDLQIEPGVIRAKVAGSSVYNIAITIEKLPAERWQYIKEQCAGGIGSVLELLQGTLSNEVMHTVCDRDNGLFPHPVDISLDCDCPDWASLCKHLAAVLYGVGARLDRAPELLFVLRGVNHEEMIAAEIAVDTASNSGTELTGDLSAIFGIDIDTEFTPPAALDAGRARRNKKKKRRIHDGADSAKRPRTSGSGKTAKKKRGLLAPKKRPRLLAWKKPRLLAKKRPPLLATKKKAQANAATRPAVAKSGINISRGLRASHLTRLRKLYQLSVPQLAKLACVTPATIYRLEKQTGVIKAHQATLDSIGAVFNLSERQVKRRLMH